MGSILHDRFVVSLDARVRQILQIPTPRMLKTVPECGPERAMQKRKRREAHVHGSGTLEDVLHDNLKGFHSGLVQIGYVIH
jgi:hypothetical protein